MTEPSDPPPRRDLPVIGRRKALALSAGALGVAAWTLRWNPDVAKDGLNAFEGLEDDRAKSHPGIKHIYTEGDHWRFEMHTVDRDGSDRQRNEAKGMRSGNTLYKITKDSTWRIACQAFWPAALTATTKFTHLMQMKVQDVGGPLWTLTPRLKDKPKLTILTLKDNDANTEHVLADYAPLQDRWIDLQFEFKASNSGGYLAWAAARGSKTATS